MIALKAPPGITSVSVEGTEYPIENGVVEVPEAAVESLRAHGFRLPRSEKRPRKSERERS